MLASTPLLQQLTDITIPVFPSITGPRQAISVHSLVGFFGVLGWAWILLISFTGWGRSFGKLFRVRGLPASVACTLGITVMVLLGGLLNLAHAIYSSVIFALVAIGIALYIAFRKERPQNYRWHSFWRQAPSAARVVLVAALLILLFRTVGTVRLGVMNGLDDGPGYLTFPHKMLEMHTFANDPFSERRVTTSVGAGYFLQSFIVSAASIANASMADRTLGLILFGCALLDFEVLFGLSALQIAWLELLAFLAPQEAMNLTFVILPISILLGMLWMVWKSLETQNNDALKYAFLAGALGGAAISLKSTYLPCVAAFALVPSVCLPGRKRPKLAWLLPIVAALGALTVLFAWMFAMKSTSGTYLFPVFGRGVDYSSYGLFQSVPKFPTTRRFIKIFLQGFALMVLAGIQLLADKGRRVESGSPVASADMQSRFSLAVLIAAAIAITAVNYASGGDSIWRYNFPQFFCAVIVYYAISASRLRTHLTPTMARAPFYAALVSLAAMVFYYDAAGKRPQPFRQVAMEWGDYTPSLHASLSGQKLENREIRAEYRAIENSLPGHAIALENTAHPFLFNYRLRRIFIADWPGAAGPAPGWPFRNNSTALASYLRDNSVRYVIYDYGYGRWTDVEGCKALEGSDLNSTWLKQQWLLSILSHNQFDRLRGRYRSVYDDGDVAVIDLKSPIADAPATVQEWTLDTDKDEICAAVMARYLANPLPARPE